MQGFSYNNNQQQQQTQINHNNHQNQAQQQINANQHIQAQQQNHTNPTIQHQMMQSNQMQNYNQSQLTQLQAMQHQFNQFQLNQNNQQQQNQNQINQTQPQQQQQPPSPQMQQNQLQQNMQNMQSFQAQPAAPNTQLSPHQNVQNVPQQFAPNQTMEQNESENAVDIKVEDSSLNPEVAEFNPSAFGGVESQSTLQLTVQEQLFAQLQSINSQMQAIKYQTESVLAPRLQQLNNNLAVFQLRVAANPQLLQFAPSQVEYFQLQQHQIMVTQQINSNQLTYNQLEHSLKYTQEMYQKNKDEQYKLDDTLDPVTNQQINNAPQTTINNTNVYNLTSAVTEVGVGGIIQHTQKEEELQTEIIEETQQIDEEQNDEEEQKEEEEKVNRINFMDFVEQNKNKTTNEKAFGRSIVDNEDNEDLPIEPIKESKSLQISKKNEGDEIKLDRALSLNELEENMDDGQIRYDVIYLINKQKDFMSINWSKYKSIPRGVRTVSKGINPQHLMEDVVAMFMRKSLNPWLAGSRCKDKKEQLIKKLTGVLNKMTPEKFTKIAKLTLDTVNEFAESPEQMNIIIGLVLQFGIKQPVFGGQYASLCRHLYDYLPKLGMICEYEWVVNDDDVSTTFRKMVIQQTNELFTTHREYELTKEEIKELQKINDDEMTDIAISKKKRKLLCCHGISRRAL